MTTYLQMVNKILPRFRKDTVATVSETKLSALIGLFINDAKTFAEGKWYWNQLRTTVQVSTVAAEYAYTLTGIDADKDFETLQVWNDTRDYELCVASWADLNRKLTTNNTATGSPKIWDVNGTDSGAPVVNVWPIPTEVELINWNLFVPQDDLSDDSDVILVPSQPVILQAWAYAIEERGEDGGTSVTRVQRRADEALYQAIMADSSTNEDELIWTEE